MEAREHPRGLKRKQDDAQDDDLEELFAVLLPVPEDANDSGAPGVPPTDNGSNDAPDLRVNLDDMFDVDEPRTFEHPSFVPGAPLHLEAKRSPKGILIRTQTDDVHGDKFFARKITEGTVLGARVQWFKAPHPFNCDVYAHNLKRVE
tara:strand:- start:869 stop:1309 length:441 start_codon:yes stop_codon:yes gene_type:complete